MGTGDQSCLVREQRLQLSRVTDGILGIGSSPPLDRQAQTLCNLYPGSRVGFMIQLGQDQLIAGLELEGCG